MRIKISEIFCSIQGEGPNLGKQAVFVRTATCNLQCVWCDTKYTWDWKNYDYKKEVREMNYYEVEKEIEEFEVKHVVLTGGEPMLQQYSLLPLISSLKRSNYYIEIETNGTIKPAARMIDLIDQWNVSPKTSNSLNSTRKREISSCFQIFKQMNNTYFKFVVESDTDVAEIHNLILKYKLPKDRIIIMPQASNERELREKSEWLQKMATTDGYSFTTRLQVKLWGNKRGV